MRPYSRKYDKAEHTYPKEMEEVGKAVGRLPRCRHRGVASPTATPPP